MEETRTCRYCGVEQPITEFNFSDKANGIRHWRCRKCFSEYNRQRYAEKGDHIRATVKAYQDANGELISERRKEAYWSDIETSRARSRANSAIQNPKRREAKQEWARQDRAKDPEKWREKGRRDYAKNPEAYREKSRRYRARKWNAYVEGAVTAELLEAEWAEWDGDCWMCGRWACEWDHLQPVAGGGLHVMENLRPACRNCNARKSDKWPFDLTPFQDPFGLADEPLDERYELRLDEELVLQTENE